MSAAGFIAAPTKLAGVLLIQPTTHADERGAFQETYRQSGLHALGVRETWVQDNHVISHRRGTLRGLHFQAPPHAQAKLIRVLRGAICDVVVDLREASATYGAHEVIRLTAEGGLQLYVPAGFAHGYCTLSDGAEVSYKTSAEYAPQSEGGLRWNDPALGIAWPMRDVEIAPRDEKWGDFASFVTPF